MPTAMVDTNIRTIKLIGLRNDLCSNTLPKTDISFGMLEDLDGQSEREHTYLLEAIGTEVSIHSYYNAISYKNY